MFLRSSLGAALIATTVGIQALFMTVGLNIFKRIKERRPEAMACTPAITTVVWVLFLLIPIVLDVTLWTTFYYVGGALPSAEEALYFSTVTFTVGYGDVVLDREWRQLATFEAVNGWNLRLGDGIDMAVIRRIYFTK